MRRNISQWIPSTFTINLKERQLSFLECAAFCHFLCNSIFTLNNIEKLSLVLLCSHDSCFGLDSKWTLLLFWEGLHLERNTKGFIFTEKRKRLSSNTDSRFPLLVPFGELHPCLSILCLGVFANSFCTEWIVTKEQWLSVAIAAEIRIELIGYCTVQGNFN